MPDNAFSAEMMQAAIFQALDAMNASRVREFSVPPTTLIGPGAIGRSGDVLAERGIKRVFVMVDGALMQSGLTDVLERNLARCNIGFDVWPCPPGEPTDEAVSLPWRICTKCSATALSPSAAARCWTPPRRWPCSPPIRICR